MGGGGGNHFKPIDLCDTPSAWKMRARRSTTSKSLMTRRPVLHALLQLEKSSPAILDRKRHVELERSVGAEVAECFPTYRPRPLPFVEVCHVFA